MDKSETRLVSCIIPTHNREELLKRAIESVIAQTYRTLEIIVVDDASQDDTESVVNEYLKSDDRIKYYKNDEPLGGSGARNVGIKTAKGEFIAFLDDDDEWLQNKIEEQIKNINSFDGLFCAVLIEGHKKISNYGKSIVDYHDLKKGNIFGGTSILFVKSEIMKNNLFDEDLPAGQDWDMYVRLARKYKIGFLNRVLVIYNKGDHRRITTESKNIPIEKREEKLIFFYKHREFLGVYWFRYLIADNLISFSLLKEKEWLYLIHMAKRFGLVVLAHVLYVKIVRKAKKILYKLLT